MACCQRPGTDCDNALGRPDFARSPPVAVHNADLREALFMEDEPSVLAAADTKPGQQQSLLFVQQRVIQMMIGGLKRGTRWIQHQSHEGLF